MIRQLIDRYLTWWRNNHRDCVFDPRTKEFYFEGDVAPESLLDYDGPGLGAMISVDPETKVITKIFFP